jgi:hypothetical protein
MGTKYSHYSKSWKFYCSIIQVLIPDAVFDLYIFSSCSLHHFLACTKMPYVNCIHECLPCIFVEMGCYGNTRDFCSYDAWFESQLHYQLTWKFSGFLSSSRHMPGSTSVSSQPFLSKCFPVHHSLVLPFPALYWNCGLSLNKPPNKNV